MDIILIILICGGIIGVGKALEEMKRKKTEKSELKERLGDDYDEFIQMRENKRKR